jgi:hypothetical protein
MTGLEPAYPGLYFSIAVTILILGAPTQTRTVLPSIPGMSNDLYTIGALLGTVSFNVTKPPTLPITSTMVPSGANAKAYIGSTSIILPLKIICFLAVSNVIIIYYYLLFGGSGEIRTHGALSDPSVFKTDAIGRTLPHFHVIIYATRMLAED